MKKYIKEKNLDPDPLSIAMVLLSGLTVMAGVITPHSVYNRQKKDSDKYKAQRLFKNLLGDIDNAITELDIMIEILRRPLHDGRITINEGQDINRVLTTMLLQPEEFREFYKSLFKIHNIVKNISKKVYQITLLDDDRLINPASLLRQQIDDNIKETLNMILERNSDIIEKGYIYKMKISYQDVKSKLDEIYNEKFRR